MAAKSGNEELYGIGAVARLTGLTDHTIRVWERRYGAVPAQRAANGRRVYSPDDVEKLGLLKRLTDQGLSIGQIAGDTLPALRIRAQKLSDIASTPMPERIGVAVLGDSLPIQLTASEYSVEPIDIVVAESNYDRFKADLARPDIDVIVLESAYLDTDLLARLRDCMRQAGATRGVIVYSFGRTRDVYAARDSRVVVTRAPVDNDDVRDAILRAYAASTPKRKKTRPGVEAPAGDWEFTGTVPPRRFNNIQLTSLAQASTQIDCECPHHLAHLVGDLTAFEVYSANCANRDEEDAALHRYLHRTTAQARALIEAALERVAKVEGIDY
jgi:hypothetical protein